MASLVAQEPQAAFISSIAEHTAPEMQGFRDSGSSTALSLMSQLSLKCGLQALSAQQLFLVPFNSPSLFLISWIFFLWTFLFYYIVIFGFLSFTTFYSGEVIHQKTYMFQNQN